ncbi:hypothetical protein [Turicibacter sanguinis]|uniref:hypothetical protein n=1 Tax=Turicibacter sanguinis TaxID=154288 RepID=UPI0018AC63FD|nr:hypothetical protein [Turicibacter sanguinis]MDB8558248.1 hypothetical protein [Turicibacter sanguinis]MDB8561024.1 hypothetical protein [Turicibacter sanguinis]
MNYYRAYGLNVQTELVLDELVENDYPGQDGIDIQIRYESMPVTILESIEHGKRSQYTQQDIWFHVKSIGIFRIQNGIDMTIEKVIEVDEERVLQYIYGRCFAFALLQRNILTLHSSTIQIGNQAIVLVGESGQH